MCKFSKSILNQLYNSKKNIFTGETKKNKMMDKNEFLFVKTSFLIHIIFDDLKKKIFFYKKKISLNKKVKILKKIFA